MSAPTFKPGDVCVVIDSPCTDGAVRLLIGIECVVIDSPCTDGAVRLLIGIECVIVGIVDSPLALLAMLLTPGNHIIYAARFADGTVIDLCHNSLRKKQPPKEKGSWLTIEKITGWLPKVEPRAVPA